MGPGDELPVGTVTFLFTDIEGSTRLLKQLREGYGEVLEEHQRILRQTFAAHDGHEIDTQGDSFFVAFRRAKEAVAAAVEGQRRLAENDWPEGAKLRVRMGIHTGEPAAAGQRYVGLGVHRAARISAAGHGGQVLVSQATRELLRDDPLPDVTLKDLGEHQLKDLDEPERVYQLVAPGLEETFPPLKTAGATPFEGREGELAEAAVEEMAARWRRPGRRTLVLATFGAAVIGVIAGVLLTQGGGSTASASVQPNSVGVFNPASGRLSSAFSAGASPGGVAVGFGATWVTNTDSNTVSQINAGSATPNQRYLVGGGPAGVAVSKDSVWVTNGLDGTVSRIDPGALEVTQPKIRVGNGPVGIAYGEGKVWVANSVDGTVTRINSTSGTLEKTFSAVPGITGIVVAFNRVWGVSPSTDTVVSLDPQSGRIDDRISVGVDPVAIAAGRDAIWVANRADDTVTKIAPQSPGLARQEDVVPNVGHEPISIAAMSGDVWVAADGTLSRISASRDQVDKTVNLANPPQALAATGQEIYLAVRSNPLEHRGGTLRVAEIAPGSLDPAVGGDPWGLPIIAMTNDGLVGFRRIGGIEGVELVPDLAQSLPNPSPDGRTFTFHLRKGIEYSTGKPVQASDFRTGLERTLEVEGGAGYFGDIEGAAACRVGRPCDLSQGIVADNAAGTVTFKLTHPDGDFLSKLALTGADAVPAGTPMPTTPSGDVVPATGPYEIASYHEGRSLTLTPNPHFRQWSADAQPAGYPKRIIFSFYKTSITGSKEAQFIEDGRVDIVPGLFAASTAELRTLATRYAAQLQRSPVSAADFFFLNTRVPPFDDLRVRLAVNYAFDRQAYKKVLGPGSLVSCQILPADFPGYGRACPYGSAGPAAVRRARQLVRIAGQAGTRVNVWMPGGAAKQGGYMVSVLNGIGLRARLKLLPLKHGISDYFGPVSKRKNHAQIGFGNWIADYPSDGGFLPGILSCRGFNLGHFCDRRVDRLFAAAERAQNPYAASALWQKAERSIVAQAPIVPGDTVEDVAFLSKRVRNFQYNPAWGVLLDQLWVHSH